MKNIALPLAFIIAASAGHAMDLAELGNRLRTMPSFNDSVSYEVLLPSLSDPVVYALSLESVAASADTLAPCSYFIGWELPVPSGTSEGFLAYFDGTHYRMRDQRLQEYHYQWTPEVFAPAGDARRGVQSQAQFSDILPQNIGQHFIDMTSDTTYITKVIPDTMVSGQKSIVVEGVRRTAGFDAGEYEYVFDATTLRPRYIEFENNPGQLSEQNIIVRYAGLSASGEVNIDENSVIARRPEAFGKYRESTFSLESLPGRKLPRISAPTSTGQRYLHERGDAFAAPTLIVFAETSVGSTSDLVRDIRAAVDVMPRQIDVVWAFLDHRTEDIERAVPDIRPGEHILVGARGAARDCGVAKITPVLIFTGTDGVVRDYIVGYNQDMTSLVIQKATLTSQQ